MEYFSIREAETKTADLSNKMLSVRTDILDLNESGFTLIYFVPDKGCISCVLYEMDMLKKHYDQLGPISHVYLISDHDDYLRTYGVGISHGLIAPGIKVFNKEMDFVNPIAALVDPSGIVHVLHVAELNNRTRTRLFFRRMLSLTEFI